MHRRAPVSPKVDSGITIGALDARAAMASDELFQPVLGRPLWPSAQVRRPPDSRILISVDAEILTNNHVVALTRFGSASSVTSGRAPSPR
jgi:hypothetical protein